ncbi:hypothetical protein ACFQ2B_36320 [Streptomyces stramineus]
MTIAAVALRAPACGRRRANRPAVFAATVAPPSSPLGSSTEATGATRAEPAAIVTGSIPPPTSSPYLTTTSVNPARSSPP